VFAGHYTSDAWLWESRTRLLCSIQRSEGLRPCSLPLPAQCTCLACSLHALVRRLVFVIVVPQLGWGRRSVSSQPSYHHRSSSSPLMRETSRARCRLLQHAPAATCADPPPQKLHLPKVCASPPDPISSGFSFSPRNVPQWLVDSVVGLRILL
jgi:hypothetical protein